jgi:hypothetical protein
MIPDLPTLSEAKDALFRYCSRDPMIGEIFEVTAAGVKETWIMCGITWQREVMHDVRGYAITLPLRPKMSFEFKVLPAGLPYNMVERIHSNMVVKASEFRYWMEQGTLEFIGSLDPYDPSCVQLLKPRVEYLNEGEQSGITAEL